MTSEGLSRHEISTAVTGLGWRYVLGVVRTAVPVDSVARAAQTATLLAASAGDLGDGHLWMDLRAEQLIVSVHTRAVGRVTADDLTLVRRLTAALAERGLRADPGTAEPTRSAQAVEVAVDALDIPAIRPFWKAVLGYVDEPDAGPAGALLDPRGQGPAFWFQQMDSPRPQRNRIHIDVSVPHDEAASRIAAAVAAGGTVIGDQEAPAFWVLADAEGNEACVTTWQGRD